MDAVKKAILGEVLEEEEAYEVMRALMAGEVSPVRAAGLLVALSLRGERPHEIAAMARAMREAARPLRVHRRPLLDIVGTGGDGKGLMNLSTLAALVAAAGGVAVAKHGNRAASSRAGSADLLEALGVEVYETDLGEYLIQLLGEPPSHIVGPAIHLSLEEIQRLFHQRFGTPLDAPPEALAQVARKVLREAFLTAELGISGANFLVAETGTLALMENEGNIRLSTSLPRVHVAFVGIEKLLPRFADLALFLPLAARAATGQRLSTFVSLIQGPAREGEEGPLEVHVVLVDHGRTALLHDPEAWETLRCLRCGACLNACPVYRQTGGHPYGYVYSGPIGAVLDPGLLTLEEAYPLPYASTLCGACLEACPVKIPIPKLLLTWRHRAVEEGLTPSWEHGAMRAFRKVMESPALYRLFSKGLRGLPLPQDLLPLLKAWTEGRGPLKPSPKPFHELWKEVERGG
jgi:L-lactate dehydrogenase complex protein LldF